MKFNHSLALSIAPVLVILDDNDDPLHLVAIGPLSLLLWFPCWLANTNWLGVVTWFSPAKFQADFNFIIQAAHPMAWMPIPFVFFG